MPDLLVTQSFTRFWPIFFVAQAIVSFSVSASPREKLSCSWDTFVRSSESIAKEKQWRAFKTSNPQARNIRILDRDAKSLEDWRVSISNLSIEYFDPGAVRMHDGLGPWRGYRTDRMGGPGSTGSGNTNEAIKRLERIAEPHGVKLSARDGRREDDYSVSKVVLDFSLSGKVGDIVNFIRQAGREISGNPNLLAARLALPAKQASEFRARQDQFYNGLPTISLSHALNAFEEAFAE